MHFLDQSTQFYFTNQMHNINYIQIFGTFNINMCSLYLYVINTVHLIGEKTEYSASAHFLGTSNDAIRIQN
jgi:hypothetical protein